MFKVKWISVNKYGEYCNAIKYFNTYEEAQEFVRTIKNNSAQITEVV